MTKNALIKNEFSEAFQAVRAILLQHWDPIGISTEPDAQDEYDSYVPQVVVLGSEGKPADVAAYLAEIETERMWLKNDWNRCRETARAVEQYFQNGN
jgi:biotin carboxylase